MSLIHERVPAPFRQGPPPQVRVTEGQRQTRSALRIDPLLSKYVVVVPPEFFHRHDGEQ